MSSSSDSSDDDNGVEMFVNKVGPGVTVKWAEGSIKFQPTPNFVPFYTKEMLETLMAIPVRPKTSSQFNQSYVAQHERLLQGDNLDKTKSPRSTEAESDSFKNGDFSPVNSSAVRDARKDEIPKPSSSRSSYSTPKSSQGSGKNKKQKSLPPSSSTHSSKKGKHEPSTSKKTQHVSYNPTQTSLKEKKPSSLFKSKVLSLPATMEGISSLPPPPALMDLCGNAAQEENNMTLQFFHDEFEEITSPDRMESANTANDENVSFKKKNSKSVASSAVRDARRDEIAKPSSSRSLYSTPLGAYKSGENQKSQQPSSSTHSSKKGKHGPSDSKETQQVSSNPSQTSVEEKELSFVSETLSLPTTIDDFISSLPPPSALMNLFEGPGQEGNHMTLQFFHDDFEEITSPDRMENANDGKDSLEKTNSNSMDSSAVRDARQQEIQEPSSLSPKAKSGEVSSELSPHEEPEKKTSRPELSHSLSPPPTHGIDENENVDEDDVFDIYADGGLDDLLCGLGDEPVKNPVRARNLYQK